MTFFQALLQGILQGLTEFLPISSSGHLSLFQHFFGISGDNALFFTVMLHMGTLVAVVVVYYKTLWLMIKEFFGMIWEILTGKFRIKNANEERKMVIMMIIALLPLVVLYFVKDFFSSLAEDNDILVEGVCFLFTGSLLFIADKCIKGNKTALTMNARDGLRVGLFQGIAMLPGVSRSGATVSAGLISGFSREFAVKFSFILGIPTILAASLVEFRDAYQEGIEIDLMPLVVGVAASAVVGFFAIKLISWIIKTNKFGIFAYYALALGTLVVVLGAIEMFAGASIVELISG